MTIETKCPCCDGDGYFLIADRNTFFRVACKCVAGNAWRAHLAYNQKVADDTARLTR